MAMENREELTEYTFSDGVGFWRNSSGQLHRDDFSPARIFRDKMEYYYYDQLYLVIFEDGARHIVNPAIYRNVRSTGTQSNTAA
jgi:hypothetical protein